MHGHRASFLWRAQGELHDAVKLTGLGKALCVAQYSGRALKRTQPERAQKVYAALFAQMTLRQKLRLFARRFIRGRNRVSAVLNRKEAEAGPCSFPAAP